MDTLKKIKILQIHRDMSNAQLAAAMTPKLSVQSLANKFNRGNLRENDIRAIGEALNCDVRIDFVKRDSGEVI